MKTYLLKEYNDNISKSEKIVFVSDHLTTGILFGNLNNMATIWITQYANKKDKINAHFEPELQ